MLIRTPVPAFGINGQGGAALTYLRQRDGMIILGKYKVMGRTKVDDGFVIDIRCFSDDIHLGLYGGTPFIQPHQLFMKMVDGGPGGLKPVLKDSDIPNERVVVVNIGHGINGETEIPVMVLGGKLARRNQLIIPFGTKFKVPSG